MAAARAYRTPLPLPPGPPPARPWRLLAALAGVLVAAVALAAALHDSSGVPDSFPNAMLPLDASGSPAEVRYLRARIAPQQAEIDGVACWPAWQCLNPDCPGRKGGEPFVFPHVDEPGPGRDGPWMACPRCARVRGRNPLNVAPWYSDEALALIRRIQR